MAQQLEANESTPLLSPDILHPTMGQEREERDHGTNCISPSSNVIIEPNPDLFTLSSSTSSGSSIMMQVDRDDESMPLLPSASQNSAMEQQQHEGREPNAHFNSPRVEHETQPSSSDVMHVGTEQQHALLPSLPPSSGEPSPSHQHSVEDHSASDIVTHQVERKQQQHHQPFSLSIPMQSSIMLRRNARAESASAARTSTSQRGLQNVTPERVRKIISTLGHDDDLSKTLFKLVMATAPFHNPESYPAPSAPGESNPQAEALRQTLGGLMFSPQSPTATTTANGPPAGNTNDNPTGNLLFDANAAETLGSRPIEPRSDSPPLLWSTAAVEEPLDPDAEDPTYYTVAEFVNTIIENKIQVESVTEEDWQIEAVRVGILNHLMNNAPEGDPVAEGGLHEAAGTEDRATEQIKTKEDTSKPDVTVKGESSKVVPTKAKAPEQAQAKEDTSESDLRRWEAQGPSGWLKREDETDMNEEEIDDECARWDAMVRKAREEKEAEMTGDGDGSSAVRLESLDLDIGEQFGSMAAQIETIGLATGDNELTTSDTAAAPDKNPPEKAIESLSQDSGLYSPSVYSEHGKKHFHCKLLN